MGTIFQEIHAAIAGSFALMLGQMGKATSTISFSTGLVFALIAGYACLKFFEMLGETEGQSLSQRVFFAYKQFRRQFVVYVLVVSAPFICAGFSGVARGQVYRSFVVIQALDQMATMADNALDSLLSSWGAISQATGRAMGVNTATFNEGERGMALRDTRRTEAYKSMERDVANAYATYQREASKKAGAKPGSIDDKAGKMAAAASANARTALVNGQSKLAAPTAEEKAAMQTQAAKDSDMRQRQNQARKDTLDGIVTSWAPWKGMMEDFKEWLTDASVYVVAAIVLLIAGAGVVSFGITVIKQSFAGMSYLIGVYAMAAIGAAIASPVAGLFMFTLISDKTEQYGRNFISFWFSMVFGCVGLATMAGFLASVIKTTVPACIGLASASIIKIGGATDIKSLGLATVGVFAAFFGAGAVLSFLMGLLRRGVQAGTGFWSGSFSA